MSLKNIFISLDHDDDHYARDIRANVKNPNNNLSFHDSSLLVPVRNECGHIIKTLPNNPKSTRVCSRINDLLHLCAVMIVIVGKDTHSCEWVLYEIARFVKIRGKQNIFAIRAPEVGDWQFPFLQKFGIDSFQWCMDTLHDRIKDAAC